MYFHHFFLFHSVYVTYSELLHFQFFYHNLFGITQSLSFLWHLYSGSASVLKFLYDIEWTSISFNVIKFSSITLQRKQPPLITNNWLSMKKLIKVIFSLTFLKNYRYLM